jgi:hypothetical protein
MPSYEIKDTGTVAVYHLYGPTGQVDTITVEPGCPVATIDTDIIPTVRVIGPELDEYVDARLAAGWSWG